MSKWTPAPWFVYEGNPLEIHAADARETIVANITGPSTNDAALADARLIAAAPEMAELLRRYLDTADKPAAQAKLADIDAEARALLAKVEGK